MNAGLLWVSSSEAAAFVSGTVSRSVSTISRACGRPRATGCTPPPAFRACVRAVRFGHIRLMYACTTTFMTSSVTCAILYVGSSLVSQGSLTTGTLVSFLLYQYNLTGALSSIADIWSGMQEAIGSSRKIFSILDRQPALRNDGTSDNFFFIINVYCCIFPNCAIRFYSSIALLTRHSGRLAPRVRSHAAAGSSSGSKSSFFAGRIDVVNVTFAYPSRPEVSVKHFHLA